MQSRSAYPESFHVRLVPCLGSSLMSDGTNQLMKTGPPVPSGLRSAALMITSQGGGVFFLGVDPKRSHTLVHLEIKYEAALHPGNKVDRFTVAETFRQYVSTAHWINGTAGNERTKTTEYNQKYKSYYVQAMCETIKAAAARFNLPAVLLAGVIYDQVDAADTVKQSFQFWWEPITGSATADRTSVRSTSLQPRDALAALGYDPEWVDPFIKKEVLESLSRDPAFAIYVRAKNLRDTFFAAKGVAGPVDGDMVTVGARSGHSPRAPGEMPKKDPQYGKTGIERRAWLAQLLSCVPVLRPPD
jgi:hypothetical protein